MPLKYRFAKKEELPTEHATLYKEIEEKDNATGTMVKTWVLDCEGVTEVTKLNEFRDNNRSLKRQLDEFNRRFEGIDPDNARKLSETVGGLNTEELAEVLKKGKEIDKVVLARTEAMRTDFEKKLKAATETVAHANARLAEVEINQATVNAALRRGLKQTAIVDITTRALRVFTLADGKPVAYEQDGRTIRYGPDGVTPYSIEEWVEKQVTEAPHLFEPNQGSGSGGGAGGGSSTGGVKPEDNPWGVDNKAEKPNMTKLMVLLKKDRTAGERLCKAHGFDLTKYNL